MAKTDVSRELMNLLYQQDQFITAKELSSKLAVSAKTIYRAINQINDKVGSPKLIITAKGKGVQINRERADKDNPLRPSLETPANALSPNKRRKQIMLRLLYVSPQNVNATALYERYYVSDSVISNDERIINHWLSRYNLKLQRVNRKVAINGPELKIRRAISALTDLSGITDFESIFNYSGVALNQVDVNFTVDLIQDAEKDLAIEIPYPYDINLFSHIYILINRYRNVGQKSSITEDAVSDQTMADEKLRHCAVVLGQRIEKYTHVSLPIAEVHYIYEYLESSRIRNLDNHPEAVSQRAVMIANAYIQKVAASLQITVEVKKLLPDLINHVRPMLNRLENGIQANNELLAEIRDEYPKILTAVAQASNEVAQEYHLSPISLDESAFITIYFAREVEESKRPLHVLITCTTGVGTAELLRVKVNNTLPDLIVDDVVSIRQYQLNHDQYDSTDFIISTIPIRNERKLPVIVVSALFGKRDQDKIRQTVNQLTKVVS